MVNLYAEKALGQIQKVSPPIIRRVYNEGSIEKLEISTGGFKGKVSPGTKGRVYFIDSNMERVIADIEVTEIKGDGTVCAKKIKGSKTIKIEAGHYVIFSLVQSSGEKDANAYYESGNVHFEKGEYDDAIADCNKAIEIDPGISYAYHLRGNAYLSTGGYDQAIEDCNKALGLNPMAETFYTRGIAYVRKREYERAIADYSKAVEMNSKYVDAYNNRGLTYVWMTEYDLAIADCNKALEINPMYLQAYNNRGLAYTGKGEYDRAIKDYNKALEIDPMHYPAYGNRGGAYMGKGEYDLAIEEFKKALDIKPDNAEAYYSMANACAEAGYKKKAIEFYKSFIRYAPPEGNSDIIQKTKQEIKELESSVGSSSTQAEIPDVSSDISQDVRRAIELLDSNDPQKQKQGIRLMRKTKSKSISIKAIPSLIKILNNNNDSLAYGFNHPSGMMLDFNSMGRKAAEILVRIGEPAVESLIPVLKSDSMLTRINAAYALIGIGNAHAVIPLITALNPQNKPEDDDKFYREWLVMALGELKDKRAVELLISILKDKNQEDSVRITAVWALGEIKDSRAIEPLVDVLDENFLDIAWHVSNALGKIYDSCAVEPLILALKNKKVRYPEKLIEALRKITGEDIGKDPNQWQEWWNQNRERFNKSE